MPGVVSESKNGTEGVVGRWNTSLLVQKIGQGIERQNEPKNASHLL